MRLSKKEVNDLCAYREMGEATAITTIAILELGRRRRDEQVADEQMLNSSKLVCAYFRANLQKLLNQWCRKNDGDQSV